MKLILQICVLVVCTVVAAAKYKSEDFTEEGETHSYNQQVNHIILFGHNTCTSFLTTMSALAHRDHKYKTSL